MLRRDVACTLVWNTLAYSTDTTLFMKPSKLAGMGYCTTNLLCVIGSMNELGMGMSCPLILTDADLMADVPELKI